VDSKELSIIAARAASDKKAEDILVMDVAALLVVTDYFVICTGRNDRQVKVIADEVEEQMRVHGGEKPTGREGLPEAKWVLLDFGDVVVHVFQPEEREFYRLEKLWGDAPRLELPKDITGPQGTPRPSENKGQAEIERSESAASGLPESSESASEPLE
jgi:ribosome-associated protein